VVTTITPDKPKPAQTSGRVASDAYMVEPGVTGAGGDLTFTARLQRNLEKPEVLASAAAGGITGIVGGSTTTQRLIFGMVGLAAPPLAYTAIVP
jgi:hypothetical protein